MVQEVLLCEKDCGTSVDLCALGCVMAELVAGSPLFEEENEYKQLTNIIRRLGIPNDMSAMPLGVSAPSPLRDTVPEEQLSQAGFDVLRGLLEFDRKDRLTAAATLQTS
ncbi:cyclin-dependent kinase G-2-like [Phragmites australis]|uniref:cyclin-dependent kinase G-2-like n=1 Tax=Phragmites australis TaxID=29695 RepID=UPI002D77C9F5|nr:cyclin-dependent kinase G-2-like [Phragmites australis]